MQAISEFSTRVLFRSSRTSQDAETRQLGNSVFPASSVCSDLAFELFFLRACVVNVAPTSANWGLLSYPLRIRKELWQSLYTTSE